MEDEDYDATFLMFDLQRNFDPANLPDGETTLCFIFSDLKDYKKWWLLISEGNVDICYEDPGKDVDVYITSELKQMTDVYMGDSELSGALKSGALKVVGDTHLTRRFSKWFPISQASSVPRVVNLGQEPPLATLST
ncbi:MAG: SCP2 sterol-binding domain-containing protein [Granulosicoccus sp.]